MKISSETILNKVRVSKNYKEILLRLWAAVLVRVLLFLCLMMVIVQTHACPIVVTEYKEPTIVPVSTKQLNPVHISGQLILGQTVPKSSFSYSEDGCDVEFVFLKHTITVDDRVKVIDETCYNEIIKHEMQHVEMNRKLMGELKHYIEQNLKVVDDKFAWLDGQSVNNKWVELQNKHTSIDTMDELRRMSWICRKIK